LYKNHKFEAHKKKLRNPTMIETLAFLKLPRNLMVHSFTSVILYEPADVLKQIESCSLKSQFSGFAANFILITPLAQAALADSQKTAKMTVKQKSIIGAFFDSEKYISEKNT